MTEPPAAGAVVREEPYQVDLGVARDFTNVDLVILPVGRDEEGRGLYPADTLFLGKNLRAAGYRVAYADPPGQRLFEVRKSAVLTAIISVGLGLLTNAAWDGVKWLIGRMRKPADTRREELEIRITDARLDSSSTTWVVRGDAQSVTEAVDRLRGTNYPADEPLKEVESRSGSGGFDTAGASDDLLEAQHQQEIDSRLSTALTGIKGAQATAADGKDLIAAEAEARGALAAFASALNWAEDTTREDGVHEEMDRAGAWVRQTFGCQLTREGTQYFQRCPVALAHTRVGLSVGGYARKRCSLCGTDLSECAHVPGVSYLVPGGSADLGWCRVCLAEGDCEHTADQMYRVGLVSTIVEMTLEEVSLVPKPAQPDARLTSMSISVEDLRTTLGEGFVPGMDVSCNRCLSPCQGLEGPDPGSWTR